MDKRTRLLEAALQLFVEFGFHNTPTSKIAKQAGIANGTLFYFFPTKDDLVKALYTDIKSRMTAHISERIRDEKSLREIMKGYYTASLFWAQEYRTEFRFMEQFNSSPYLNKIAEEEIRRNLEPVQQLLQQGIQEQVLKPLDVDLILTLVSGHIFGLNKYLLDKELPVPEQTRVIDKSFTLLWNMLSR